MKIFIKSNLSEDLLYDKLYEVSNKLLELGYSEPKEEILQDIKGDTGNYLIKLELKKPINKKDLKLFEILGIYSITKNFSLSGTLTILKSLPQDKINDLLPPIIDRLIEDSIINTVDDVKESEFEITIKINKTPDESIIDSLSVLGDIINYSLEENYTEETILTKDSSDELIENKEDQIVEENKEVSKKDTEELINEKDSLNLETFSNIKDSLQEAPIEVKKSFDTIIKYFSKK